MLRYIGRRACFPLAAALSILAPSPVGAQGEANSAAALPDRADVLESAAVSRARGAHDAAVVVYEIADFQCPFCARFAEEVFPRIDSTYVRTGLVQWVFVNLPLPAHREAWPAAEAALCAGATAGGFWSMHDILYARQAEWSGDPDARGRFRQYVRDAGAYSDDYERCIAEDRVAPLILQDVLGASDADISGTPTFIVNRQLKVVGLRTYEEWVEILDGALGR